MIKNYSIRVQYRDGSGMNDDGCSYTLKFLRFVEPYPVCPAGGIQFELLDSGWISKTICIPLDKNFIEFLESMNYHIIEFIEVK